MSVKKRVYDTKEYTTRRRGEEECIPYVPMYYYNIVLVGLFFLMMKSAGSAQARPDLNNKKTKIKITTTHTGQKSHYKYQHDGQPFLSVKNLLDASSLPGGCCILFSVMRSKNEGEEAFTVLFMEEAVQ